jgi:hypothetical protein
MCPDKDKETGMYAFNFNVEEVKNVTNQDMEESCDIWWCKEATKELEWTKIDGDNGYRYLLFVEKEDEQSIPCNNHYNVLYKSDNDNNSLSIQKEHLEMTMDTMVKTWNFLFHLGIVMEKSQHLTWKLTKRKYMRLMHGSIKT